MTNEMPDVLSERHVALREALIDAAEAVIARSGHEAIRARPLAEAAGCALGAIYTVFPDLPAIILAVKSRTLEALDGAMTATVAERGNPTPALTPAQSRALLLDLGQSYRVFAAERYHLWRALFQYPQPGAIPDWYQTRLEALFRHVDRPLAVLMPEVDPAARALFGRALFSAVHGIISLGLDEKLGATPADDVAKRVQVLVATVLDGLAAGPLS